MWLKGWFWIALICIYKDWRKASEGKTKGVPEKKNLIGTLTQFALLVDLTKGKTKALIVSERIILLK